MKYILITGASSSLGRAIAVALAEQDTLFILTGRNQTRLLQTKRQVTKKGAKAEIFIADLSQSDDTRRLAGHITATYPQVNGFIHVAGVWHGSAQLYANCSYRDFSEDIVHDTLTVGLLAPMLLLRTLLPSMSADSVIMTISGTFSDGARGWLPYYVSKRALEDFTIGLSQELADTGIRVLGISPSDTLTDAYRQYFPQSISAAIKPEVVAASAAHLWHAKSITGIIEVIKKNHPPHTGFHE